MEKNFNGKFWCWWLLRFGWRMGSENGPFSSPGKGRRGFGDVTWVLKSGTPGREAFCRKFKSFRKYSRRVHGSSTVYNWNATRASLDRRTSSWYIAKCRSVWCPGSTAPGSDFWLRVFMEKRCPLSGTVDGNRVPHCAKMGLISVRGWMSVTLAWRMAVTAPGESSKRAIAAEINGGSLLNNTKKKNVINQSIEPITEPRVNQSINQLIKTNHWTMSQSINQSKPITEPWVNQSINQ